MPVENRECKILEKPVLGNRGILGRLGWKEINLNKIRFYERKIIKSRVKEKLEELEENIKKMVE